MGSIIRHPRTGFPLQYDFVPDCGVWFTSELRFSAVLAAVFLDVLAWNRRWISFASNTT